VNNEKARIEKRGALVAKQKSMVVSQKIHQETERE